MDIGVRELKQHLSEYLDRAAAGEIIRVTDRGQPKATLGPIVGAGRLQRGIDEGWLRPAVTDAGLAPVERFEAPLRVLDVLDDDRGE